MKFKIEYLEEVDSTNTLMQLYAKEGAAEGLVVVADFQTGGRGKPGNRWVSPKGQNLLFSVLMRPPIDAHEAPMLTQIVCRSVAAVLKKEFNLDCTFKSPNDVLIGGKKICGVLIESASGGKKLQSAVIGIGLNVNSLPEELVEGAVSIKALTNKDQDRDKLLKKLLDQIKKDVQTLGARHRVPGTGGV